MERADTGQIKKRLTGDKNKCCPAHLFTSYAVSFGALLTI